MVLGNSASELVAVKAPVTEVPLHVVTKARSRVPATRAKSVLKVVNSHFSAAYLSSVSRNPNRVEYKGINLDTLQELIDRKKLKAVTLNDLMENGLAGKRDLVKILGRGELKTGVPVTAHKFSASAKAAIEAAGGEATEA